MALEKILKDGSETGATAADKINTAFDTIDGIKGYLYSRVLDVLDIQNTAYSDLGSLEIPDMDVDTEYDIYFSAVGNYDNSTNSVLVEFSVTGGDTWNVWTHEQKDTTDRIMFSYPFPFPVLANSGAFTLMMRAIKENTAGTFDIQYANIVCNRVG